MMDKRKEFRKNAYVVESQDSVYVDDRKHLHYINSLNGSNSSGNICDHSQNYPCCT